MEYRKSRFSISVSSHTACNRGVMTYFGREKSRTKEEILARQVVCLKKDRGVPGSRERSRHHQSATAPLAQKFGAAGHWVVRNRDGESDSQNYDDLQSAYVGNLAKVALLEKRVNEYDMMSVLMIWPPKDMNAASVEDRWGDPKDAKCLLTHWSSFSLDVVKQWQKDTNEECVDDEDLTSCEWIRQLLGDSSASELIHRVDETYNKITTTERGGVTRLKIQLDEMFCITNDVVQALQSFLTKVSEEGPSRIPGENIAELTAQVNAVCERLSAENRLPVETPICILEGLTKCSVPEFKGPFQLLLDQARVDEMSTVSSVLVTCADTLDRVKEITTMANNSYHSLNTAQKWNTLGDGGAFAFDANASDEEDLEDDESEGLSCDESEEEMSVPDSVNTGMSDAQRSQLANLIQETQVSLDDPELSSFLANLALIMGSN